MQPRSLYLGPRIQLNVSGRDLSNATHMADSRSDINSELDEMDREEFYRLKKVSGINSVLSELNSPIARSRATSSVITRPRRRPRKRRERKAIKRMKMPPPQEIYLQTMRIRMLFFRPLWYIERPSIPVCWGSASCCLR